MLINEEYFKGEIVIPNLNSIGNGISSQIASSNLELLLFFIDKYEKRFLVSLLGRDRADEFYKEIEKGELSGKWLDLKNRLVDETLKISPIANYVYYWYRRCNVSVTTDIGEMETDSDNSVRVSPALKMCRAWNEMVDWVIDIQKWMKTSGSFNYRDIDMNLLKRINTFNL